MIKRLDGVKLRISRDERDLLDVARKNLGAPVKYFEIIKKSLDARDKSNIFWVYSIAFSATEEAPQRKALEKRESNAKIVVVGSGPAGLACAVRLVEHGYKPIILERGEAVEERRQKVKNFCDNRVLDVNSNVQFGEGGAGAFSDGKLNTQTKDGFNRDVLETFVRFGAPKEILYLNKPHIGSDNLYGVLQNIRKFILDNGGEFYFNSKLCGLKKKDGALVGVMVENVRTGERREMPCDCAVVAIGHSARDTFRVLQADGVQMEAKEFAVGVRIEHLAKNIGLAQYGESYKILPTADYKLVSHAHERAVFTFCMCPGGVVIPAASEQGGVAVNGMSYYKRDGVNSNSALMVQMKRQDFGSENLFAGMEFQQEIERKAYLAGGADYRAPVQLFGDFKIGKVSCGFKSITPTYAAGTAFSDLNAVLPKVVADALKVAVPDMAKRLKGFDCPDAVLTGVETRFSSPVKMIRGKDFQSVSVKNLYPCGEGSGYSGGITSSAADGIAVAETIFNSGI